jgi:hypothetical protein
VDAGARLSPKTGASGPGRVGILHGLMDMSERPRESRREAVLASLAFVATADVDRRFRELMNGNGGALNEWDQRFLDFIAARSGERLLSGTLGGGFFFAFSPRDAAGFWILSARDGAKGKGFLTRHDAERILELARIKGLIPSS